MATRHGRPPEAGKLPTIGVVVAVGAFLLGFVVPPLAVLLALAALVIGIVVLVRSRGGKPGRQAGLATVAVAVVGLVVAGIMSPAPPPEAPVAAPPPVDPNALPAAVTVASAQSPDNLLTTGGRRLHVTMMQGRPAPDACQARSDIETTTGLVVGKQVQIAAPDPLRIDVPTAVPPGFQAVVLTLPDGRDYAQAWSAAATQNAAAACARAEAAPTTTTEPGPTTTQEPPVVVEEDEDVDRPYVPAPRTRAPSGGSGGSGHPCLPGERDGDGDGYCGE